jgi:3-hydroxyacyl-CoA dehydrogenase
MPDEKIGIISNGGRGESLAFSFARKKFQVLIYELDRERAEGYIKGTRQNFEMKDLSWRKVYRPVIPNLMKWVESFEDLNECDYVIEASTANIETRREYLKKAEALVAPGTPLMSETFLYLPGDLSSHLEDNSRFLVSFFWDIEYTGNSVELVIHPSSSDHVLERVKNLLREAGFVCGHVKECLGYVHNRVGLLGIQNLFRMYDEKILSYENLTKYFVSNKREPYILNLPLKHEIRTELYPLLSLFRMMNKHYGERFYVPEFLKEEFSRENVGEIIRQASVEYSIDEQDVPEESGRTTAVHDTFEHILVTGIQLTHNNLVFPLKRYKKIYFDSADDPYFSLLKTYYPKLHQQLMEEAVFMDGDSSAAIDLIIDFSIQEHDKKIEQVRRLQDRFGPNVPILLNTPMFKIADIAADSTEPRMIFGMYTQKNYLRNTEIVLSSLMDRGVYLKLKGFLKQITGDYIETGDAPVRPLYLMIASKWLESVRLLEEGLADIEAIEFLGADRKVFDDIDMFGLNNLITTCEYLKDHYPHVYTLPEIVMEMEKENKLGYATGIGFLDHR